MTSDYFPAVGNMNLSFSVDETKKPYVSGIVVRALSNDKNRMHCGMLCNVKTVLQYMYTYKFSVADATMIGRLFSET